MISKNAIIESNDIQIGKNVIIGDGVEIRCPEKIHIGDNSVLTKNIKINCTSFEAGEYFYMTERCEVGRGGIGADVMIWTHGAWLDVLQGFPADFGPVKIGSNVWLPARSVVLPHVIIGDNVVIGINSIINRSLPDGCFAAGSPCKVIKENVYPKKLTEDEKKNIVLEIIDGWYKLHDMKKIKDVLTKYEDGKIYLNQGKHQTIYYMDERKIEGYNNNVSEDLRDYMRRRGIKIYTGELFRSI